MVWSVSIEDDLHIIWEAREYFCASFCRGNQVVFLIASSREDWNLTHYIIVDWKHRVKLLVAAVMEVHHVHLRVSSIIRYDAGWSIAYSVRRPESRAQRP